jgi:peptidoglycan/LPS O-acetylase OafA/YrhL
MRPPAHINTFNLVRFFAAIQIVNGHLFEPTLISHHLPVGLVVLLASSASYSTSLFFVLSGFVLAYARQHRIDQNRASLQPLQLLARHLFRAGPYVLIGAAIAGAFEAKQQGLSASLLLNYIISISLVSPFFFCFPPLNGAAWAMSVFVLGYLIDAFIGHRLCAKPTRWYVVRILSILALLYFLTLFYPALPGSSSYPPRIHGPWHSAIHIFPFPRILEVLLGMLLGAFTHGRYFQIKAMIETVVFPRQFVTLLIVALNLECLWMISRLTAATAFMATHGLLLVPMCAMLLALSVSDYWGNSSNLIKPVRFLGNLSLPIYLLHAPGMQLFRVVLELANVNLASDSWLFMFGFFGFLAALSTAMMLFVHGGTNSAKAWMDQRGGAKLSGTKLTSA